MHSISKVILFIQVIFQITKSSPVQFHQVILYEKGDGQDNFEILNLNQLSTCTPIPKNWSNKSIDAIGLEKFCIRLWNDDRCSSGQKSRCYCDSRYLSLEKNNFLISKNTSWSSSIKAVGPCILKGEENGVSINWLFSEENFKGNLTTLVIRPKECLSFPTGDKWDGYGKSSWLWRGCVQFYGEQNCLGENFKTLSRDNISVNDINLKSVKSVKNCAGAGIDGDKREHGVGVSIYPRGFEKGLPWNIME